jgi:hypothetical protein
MRIVTMKLNTILISSIFTVALLAGCDKGGEQKAASTESAAPASAAAPEAPKEGFGAAVESAATSGT